MPHSAIELTKQELNRLPGLVAAKNLSEIKQVVSKVKDSKEWFFRKRDDSIKRAVRDAFILQEYEIAEFFIVEAGIDANKI